METGNKDRAEGGSERRLSGREGTILRMAAEGCTDRQISTDLELSIGTVRTYWSRIRVKLAALTRAQAVGIYVRMLGGDGVRKERPTVEPGRCDVQSLACCLGAVAWIVRRPSNEVTFVTEDCDRYLGGDAGTVSQQPGGWRSGLCKELSARLQEAELELESNSKATVCTGVTWSLGRGRCAPVLLSRLEYGSNDYAVLILPQAVSVRAPRTRAAIL